MTTQPEVEVPYLLSNYLFSSFPQPYPEETLKTVRVLKFNLPLWLVITGLALGLFVVGVGAYRLISGRPLGLRSWVSTQLYFASSNLKVLADQKNVSALNQGEFTNLIFLHHSVGDNIISQGGLRELLAQSGIHMTDQDYIEYGLSGPDGAFRGYTLSIPNDNTDPDGLARIFNQPRLPLPLNAFSGLMQYEVVMMKSCFPANYIYSAEQVAQYKDYYLSIRDRIEETPERFFILLTIPPLNVAETNPADAARAREVAEWMTSPEFTAGHPNMAVFDLYGFLAGDDRTKSDYNALKAEYSDGADSHPNQLANAEVAPVLAEFIRESIETYRASQLARN